MAGQASRIPPAFFPPDRSPLLVAAVYAFSRWILLYGGRIEKVLIDPDSLARLRALRETRGLVLSNHPTLADPAIQFVALSRAGLSFHMLSAWDTMALHGRMLGWALQKLGGYSIHRGRPDRAAMKATQDLLLRGQRIVVFPEGVTYGLNDAMLPFQQGVAQMGLRAADAMQERGIDAPLVLQPTALKYVFTQQMDGEIESSLIRLEERFSITAASTDRYQRLLAVAGTVLESLERAYRLDPASATVLSARIDRIRDAVVARLAEALNVTVPPNAAPSVVVQLLGNAYDDALAAEPEAGDEARAETLSALHADWLRLKNFLAVREGHIQENPTPERWVDVLGRLETEVLGKQVIGGRKVAIVAAGEPLDLRDRLTEYRNSKRAAIESVTREMESRVRTLLDGLILRGGVGENVVG